MSQSFVPSDSSSARSQPPPEVSALPTGPTPPPAPRRNVPPTPMQPPKPSEAASQRRETPQPPLRPVIDTQGMTDAASNLSVGSPAAGGTRPVLNAVGSLTGKPLPPPPPPRSTLPPVRPISEVSGPRTGIGSATTRWRGSLPEIETAAAPNHSPSGTASPLQSHESTVSGADPENPSDVVTRSAPSWLLSLVIHLIVLLVLALVTTPVGNGFTNLVLDFGISDEPIEDALELDIDSLQTDQLIEAPVDAIDDTLVESEIPDLFEMIEPAEMAAIEPTITGAEALEIAKPMFGGRTGAMRKALMAMFGATDETRDAVKLGLAWLKRQQNSKGYWSMQRPYTNGAVSENRPAATAMALLAFAGDGNTHLAGPYRQEVEQGLKYLVAQQDRGGFMASSARGNERTYAQAQATIALCELYGMTKDSWLRAYAQRAIDYAVKTQASNGGWRYRPNEPGDTSVTGWYVMALQSALGSGLEVPEQTMLLISGYLDSASVYHGAGYAYQPGRADATPTMTAEGLLCRQYLGWPRNHAPMRDGLNLLRADAPFDINNQNVYYWYYATQVFPVDPPHKSHLNIAFSSLDDALR